MLFHECVVVLLILGTRPAEVLVHDSWMGLTSGWRKLVGKSYATNIEQARKRRLQRGGRRCSIRWAGATRCQQPPTGRRPPRPPCCPPSPPRPPMWRIGSVQCSQTRRTGRRSSQSRHSRRGCSPSGASSAAWACPWSRRCAHGGCDAVCGSLVIQTLQITCLSTLICLSTSDLCCTVLC